MGLGIGGQAKCRNPTTAKLKKRASNCSFTRCSSYLRMAVTCNNNTVIPPMSRCLCPIAQLGECQTEDLSCSDLQSDALPLGAAWTQEFTSGIKVTGYVQHFNLSTSKGGGIAPGRNRSGWRVRGSRSVQALKIGPVGIRKHYYRKHQSGMNRDQEIRGAKSKALLLLEREHCLRYARK